MFAFRLDGGPDRVAFVAWRRVSGPSLGLELTVPPVVGFWLFVFGAAFVLMLIDKAGEPRREQKTRRELAKFDVPLGSAVKVIDFFNDDGWVPGRVMGRAQPSETTFDRRRTQNVASADVLFPVRMEESGEYFFVHDRHLVLYEPKPFDERWAPIEPFAPVDRVGDAYAWKVWGGSGKLRKYQGYG